MLAAEAFDEGASLFKFAARGGMKPHIALALSNLVAKDAPGFALPIDQQACFSMAKQGQELHHKGVEIYR